MKRILAMLTCAALLALGGCGFPRNGVKWSTIDLRDETYADVKAWLEEDKYTGEFSSVYGTIDLSENYKLAWDWGKIFLNNTPILEEMGVLGFEGLRGDYVYLSNGWMEDIPPNGTRRLFRIDLRKLPEVEAVDLLEGIPRAQYTTATWSRKLSPEGKTFIVATDFYMLKKFIDIYDLENRRLLASVRGAILPYHYGGYPYYYYDEKTIYCPFRKGDDYKAVKITLP